MMEEERRKPDVTTWLWRILVSAALGFCTILLTMSFFFGKGWVEQWMTTISDQNMVFNARLAAIEANTKDLAVLKDHVQILWKKAGLP